jgi:hypothetical protein
MVGDGQSCHVLSGMVLQFGRVLVRALVLQVPGGMMPYGLGWAAQKVAAVIWECLEYRRSEAPDLLLQGGS